MSIKKKMETCGKNERRDIITAWITKWPPGFLPLALTTSDGGGLGIPPGGNIPLCLSPFSSILFCPPASLICIISCAFYWWCASIQLINFVFRVDFIFEPLEWPQFHKLSQGCRFHPTFLSLLFSLFTYSPCYSFPSRLFSLLPLGVHSSTLPLIFYDGPLCWLTPALPSQPPRFPLQPTTVLLIPSLSLVCFLFLLNFLFLIRLFLLLAWFNFPLPLLPRFPLLYMFVIFVSLVCSFAFMPNLPSWYCFPLVHIQL